MKIPIFDCPSDGQALPLLPSKLPFHPKLSPATKSPYTDLLSGSMIAHVRTISAVIKNFQGMGSPPQSSSTYQPSPPYNFHSFFKPLLGKLRKNEVTSMELNLFFLISPNYCGTIRLLTGARRGRKNRTKNLSQIKASTITYKSA